ncbi:MAG: ABC transporter ATP-binding protein [Nitrospira sp.]
MKALRIQSLTKEYSVGFTRQHVVALDHLNLEVEEGEIFGFLGQNGAGKTTAIKLLLGLLRPTSGKAWIFDRSIEEVAVRQYVGYLPESPYFYEYLTAEEFLAFYGQLFGLRGIRLARKVEELLELVSLTSVKCIPLRKFSKGMLQRVGIAQALINDPRLVILDEPMSGLDPIGRRDVRDIILHLRAERKTVFFSTHILSDVEMICDRIGILAKGCLKAVGDVQAIVGEATVKSIELVVEGLHGEAVAEILGVGATVVARGNQALISVSDEAGVNKCLEILRQRNGRLVSLLPQKQSLEDIFLKEAGANQA